MSQLLKDKIDPQNIKKLAVLINKQAPDFDIESFQKAVLTKKWAGLSLKQRIRHLTLKLNQYLNSPKERTYQACLACIKPVSIEFSGLFHFVFSDYVECFGLAFFDESIEALALFTQNSTSEFAIRVFLESQADKTKRQLIVWAKSDNAHLRRLASEGVRPKLPWSKHLPWIAANPNWVKPIIETLKSDASLYVRKSVANLLNDLSKNQPEWVLKRCKAWQQEEVVTKETQWIIKHALRTLLKQGQSDALAIIGYGSIDHLSLMDWQSNKRVGIGDKLDFSFGLRSSMRLGLLRLEYAVSFLRKSQKPFRKVFKIAESDYSVIEKQFTKHHNFKRISTRTYVAGVHTLELIVNGQCMKTVQFELVE